MTIFKRIACLLFMALPLLVVAKEIHVSPNGNDANVGTIDKPVRTITKAIEKMEAGDICILHGGTYRENIVLKKSGEPNAYLHFQAARGERPIITGLDELKLDWSATDKPSIYKAHLPKTNFQQLFFNGKPLLEARWPNVPKDKNGDWDFFSPNAWATVDTVGNNYGIISDQDLAATGWDITGTNAVLNVDHQYYVWTRQVENHTAGSSKFTYPKDLGSSIKPKDETGGGINFNDDRYYLFGKQMFLDAPGEWYYDSTNEQLWVASPNGKPLTEGLLEIKTRDYAFSALNGVSHVYMEGITFFGTAFCFGKLYGKPGKNVVFKNNEVLYSSCTQYFIMPKEDSKAKYDEVNSIINADNAMVCNNIFAYGELKGLLILGFNNLIENNIFRDFDLSSCLNYPPLECNRNWPYFEGKGGNAIVRWNTFYNSGGIATQIGLSNNDVYLNDVYQVFRSSYGGNKDASAIYTQSVLCHGTRIHHNWVHDSYAGTPFHKWGGGMGIRGDDKTVGLTVDHNVAWNLGSTGLELKTPTNATPDIVNRVYNNIVFQHSHYNKTKCGMIVVTENGQNKYTLVENNLSSSINGQWFGKPLGEVASYKNNVTDIQVENLLINAKEFDFRPIVTSSQLIDQGKKVDTITETIIGSNPDIGAYELGDSVYWIPGRREIKASFPIVADGATVTSSLDQLMWRQAYNAIGYKIFMGENKESLTQMSILLGEKNVFALPKLSNGKTYYWRVDALFGTGVFTKGDVWSFKTQSIVK